MLWRLHECMDFHVCPRFFVRPCTHICACVMVGLRVCRWKSCRTRTTAGCVSRIEVLFHRVITVSARTPALPRASRPGRRGTPRSRGSTGRRVLPPREPSAPRSAQPQRCWRQAPGRAAGFQPPQAGNKDLPPPTHL